MAFVAARGSIFTGVTTVFSNVVGRTIYPCIFDQVRHYAARVGTRARKLKLAKQAKLLKTKKLLRMIEQKKQLEKKKYMPLSRIRLNDVLNGEPLDNVWTYKRFQWPIYTMEDAVKAFHETYHPTMYNVKNPPIYAFIELDMRADKKGKFIKAFNSVQLLPYVYPTKTEKKIMAFTNNAQLFEDAMAAGAAVVGGKELIKEIQAGDVSANDFDYYVADITIINDLGPLRGLLGSNLPSHKKDTLAADIVPLIKKFKLGIEYEVKPHAMYPEYATCTVMIGTLDMDPNNLSENLFALVDNIYLKKPKKRDDLVTRIQVQCPPSHESFKLCLEEYLPKELLIKKAAQKETDEIDDGPESSNVIISNV